MSGLVIIVEALKNDVAVRILARYELATGISSVAEVEHA